MKKIMIFAAIAAMFSLASCQKDEVVANNEAKVSPVFTASINAGATKTTVNVTNGKIAWEDTDEITITDNSGTSAVYEIESIAETTGKATFKLKSGQSELGDGPYKATYGSTPSTYQTYSTAAGKLYMTAPATSNNSFTFTVQCGLMKLNLSKFGETITHIAVTGTPTGGTTKMTYTMYCPGVVDISSGKDFFIALPAGCYDKIEVYKHDATNGFMVCSLSPSTSIAISDNHIKPVNASDGKIAFSESQNLPGVFSVSNDGGTTIKQIRFSKGNLNAKNEGTTESPDWKWHFYDKQYNFLAANMAVSGSSIYPQRTVNANETEIDLFTWGYDAANSIDPDGTNYVTGHTADNETFNPAEDWGSQIGDGSTWRTLTTAEWQYLFNTRTNASNKVGFATVNDVYGIIILPDTFTDPMKNGGSAAFVPKSTTGWSANVYTTGGNWEAMESAGAVFLPAAGYRHGSDVYSVGFSGRYWSSAAYNSTYAHHVYFFMHTVFPDDNANRNRGYSVRLITECQ